MYGGSVSLVSEGLSHISSPSDSGFQSIVGNYQRLVEEVVQVSRCNTFDTEAKTIGARSDWGPDLVRHSVRLASGETNPMNHSGHHTLSASMAVFGIRFFLLPVAGVSPNYMKTIGFKAQRGGY